MHKNVGQKQLMDGMKLRNKMLSPGEFQLFFDLQY